MTSPDGEIKTFLRTMDYNTKAIKDEDSENGSIYSIMETLVAINKIYAI